MIFYSILEVSDDENTKEYSFGGSFVKTTSAIELDRTTVLRCVM